MDISLALAATTCTRCGVSAEMQPGAARFDPAAGWVPVNVTRPVGWTPDPRSPADVAAGLCAPCAAEWHAMHAAFLAGAVVPPQPEPEPRRPSHIDSRATPKTQALPIYLSNNKTSSNVQNASIAPTQQFPTGKTCGGQVYQPVAQTAAAKQLVTVVNTVDAPAPRSNKELPGR